MKLRDEIHELRREVIDLRCKVRYLENYENKIILGYDNDIALKRVVFMILAHLGLEIKYHPKEYKLEKFK